MLLCSSYAIQLGTQRKHLEVGQDNKQTVFLFTDNQAKEVHGRSSDTHYLLCAFLGTNDFILKTTDLACVVYSIRYESTLLLQVAPRTNECCLEVSARFRFISNFIKVSQVTLSMTHIFNALYIFYNQNYKLWPDSRKQPLSCSI